MVAIISRLATALLAVCGANAFSVTTFGIGGCSGVDQGTTNIGDTGGASGCVNWSNAASFSVHGGECTKIKAVQHKNTQCPSGDVLATISYNRGCFTFPAGQNHPSNSARITCTSITGGKEALAKELAAAEEEEEE